MKSRVPGTAVCGVMGLKPAAGLVPAAPLAASAQPVGLAGGVSA